MTSPSLKNHPTTAQPSPTRSKPRSLWKQLLAGALCLAVTGALPANDREVGKPLDRLKQRSARQRWRELRGDWVPAPDIQDVTDPRRPAPFSSPFTPKAVENQAVPIPTVGEIPTPTEDEPVVAPVPEPAEVTSDDSQSLDIARPSAKPDLDPKSPLAHPGSLPESAGSFADVELEPRTVPPRERRELKLPHWPFDDDLDLILPEPDDNPLAEAEEPAPPMRIPVPVPAPELPEPPIQVAEVPEPGQADAPTAQPAAPVAEATSEPAVVARPLPKMRPIREIQPFANYKPQTGSKLEGVTPPTPIELVSQGSLERHQAATAVYWHASNVTHNPLYFEDPGLERSGHTFSDAVQPFVSVGRLGAQIVALPYSIALDPVWKDESPLGHYRPGECAPKRHLALPINREAVATAAAAYTGIIYLIP